MKRCRLDSYAHWFPNLSLTFPPPCATIVPRSLGSSDNAKKTLKFKNRFNNGISKNCFRFRWNKQEIVDMTNCNVLDQTFGGISPKKNIYDSEGLLITSVCNTSPHLASISLVWSVRMELSAFTMTARADITPPFSSRFTLLSMKSFLSWENNANESRLYACLHHFLFQLTSTYTLWLTVWENNSVSFSTFTLGCCSGTCCFENLASWTSSGMISFFS